MINPIISNIQNNKNIVNIFLIFISLFLLTIIPINNIPVHDQNADSYNGELTAYSLNFVNNWLKDGIIHDKFVTYCDYASVEFENNHDRNMYLSYPPGAFLPLYLIAKGIGAGDVSVGFIKYFIQVEYYLSILLLGLLFYVCLKILQVRFRLFMIALPVIFSSLWAFLPYNVYYLKNIYFTDQAVILLSIIFFLIEFALYDTSLGAWKKILQGLSCAVLFAGILTDYYFYCIAFAAISFRILTAFQDHPRKSILYKLFSDTWPLIVTAIVATALFIIQLIWSPNGLKLLVLTFLIRADSGADFGGVNGLINHFNIGFSVFSIPVLMMTALFCFIFPFIRNRYGQDKQMLVRWLSIIILPAVLHTVILREHSIIHEFSMLKYNLVFVFIIFSFVCWIYLSYRTREAGGVRKVLCLAVLFILGVLLFSFRNLNAYGQFFYEKRMFTDNHSIAHFIKNHTNYFDVVYSPDYEIYWNQPQDLAISQKRVYKISSLEEIPYDRLPEHAVINILISCKTLKNPVWSKLGTGGSFSGKSNDLYLFKFRGKSFRSVID